ncbi:hypothetical protein [Enterobacter hormaechei]|uniref:hypothetical protein n=1 Tax=Enterobacter hormaechei TaxID=158836 RepID=UPI000F844EC6|nr:hypothetical protein [Enterobacter hormaechei]RTM57464.1 hypothetical protein EKO17_23790 [Enterobacter hormaechei subsp. xiangfangensis]
MNQIHNTNNLTTATQNRMLPQTQSRIRRVIYATCFFMLTLIIIAEKYKLPYHQVVSSIIISSSIALIYLLTIYLQYGSRPEKQKRLKAYIDAFANALALLAIIVTFTSFVLYGEASALYTTMASSKSSDVFFGVIIGVLSSRVLFPFWDLHSKYKKI